MSLLNTRYGSVVVQFLKCAGTVCVGYLECWFDIVRSPELANPNPNPDFNPIPNLDRYRNADQSLYSNGALLTHPDPDWSMLEDRGHDINPVSSAYVNCPDDLDDIRYVTTMAVWRSNPNCYHVCQRPRSTHLVSG